MKEFEVLKGDYRILKGSDETIVTKNLGSGLCVCVRDTKNGLLGLCHLVVPKASERDDSFPVFDCSEGIRIFFNTLLDRGAQRENLEIWLIGSGQFLECPNVFNIGAQNYSLVKRAIEKNGLNLKGEHVGGPFNKSVRFSLHHGPVVTVPGTKKEIML
ncbi:Chemotaxis protein CheD [Dissulfuribacter thermophilus]|uniref:Chemotaxis protein CheD n=1 Tax=Dissulfuribacter thermophilus TaxID=1156395 RepID=A0A1B9F6G2_9BACT|nr:chemotaxis protein CheD [Dissulfuribacter thermophilus]OCC15424.1 Chemotaxis protein CheD [Dissulfuribacter thermophilus]